MTTFWILLTACLASAACALVGTYLVLRKQAMLSDAISHAVLPGIAIAFLLTASRNTFPMLLGAGAFGLLTVYLTEKLQERGRLMNDASMGIVFTTLFAIGVIIITLFAGSVDLDHECILFGEIAYVPWDLWIFAGMNMGPRPVWILGMVLVINLIFILSCYKELKIYAFDRQLAVSMGIPVVFIHYGLMGTVSFSTIASFESVGAILVVALIIVPPATAYLLTRRLSVMLILSVSFGVLSSLSGYYLALVTDTSIAGAIAVMTGVFFGLALLFSPQEGVITKRNKSIQNTSTQVPETAEGNQLS
ncbi:manganese/zinc/iron transport system permease protein [Cyclonatronum proteinivorum]|uniref:Manganese/zinc/iron transport system permease protein n=1 Tax=Cyclonatronum proteinivorum TaxID=1457365 RepID=A0A345UIB1_9BACT|nr:metal ABC transporter permease [Cyclonatronum proteinivorum]AXJ00213.1 manganese/zinc/iron transport system permease protein [Cyclonatronum proteinivorum]